jgi:hypothetical protein
MSFFPALLLKHHLAKHDGRPLWKYSLTDQEYENLISEINYAAPLTLDPRDACVYYSEWWKRNYNGGKPSKEEIFKNLSGNIKYRLDYEDFFKLAKKGANMLGIKWVSKQYTLYFRTLLLQGGLPLKHISENHGKYQIFLLAVLEEQPDSIEDFIFKPHVINHLPVSSQNDIIYENCFEIVKSILNEEDIYDELLNFNEVIKNISGELKIRKAQLQRIQRLSKPKNYWLLSFKKGKITISLRIGFANKYDPESLAGILGFNVSEKEYQFYLNDELICIFRKMLDGNYKTDWFSQQDHDWNAESNLPYSFVLVQGKKYEVNDFIQIIPNLHEPSLWSKYSDNEWRLIKGNGTSNKEAAILFPTQWKSNITPEEISLYGKNLSWLTFEGEIQISCNENSQQFLSETNSFDWTIINQKPSWMLKANMPVIQKNPTIIVYDENNRKLPESLYKISFKSHNSRDIWQDLSSQVYLPLGCIDLKIEKADFVAYDMCFNLGNLHTRSHSKSIDQAEIMVTNVDRFNLKLDETECLSISQNGYQFSLRVKTEYKKIPTGVMGSVGIGSQKKLYFTMVSPFEGMAIIDNEGNIISEDQQLSLKNLYGLRILSTPNIDTIVTIKNVLKPDVKIIKEITEQSYPVISLKNEIVRLYYLADAMEFRNTVSLELKEGSKSSSYRISGFTNTLSVEDQFNNQVSLFNSNDELDLYAIPVNCTADSIDLIPLVHEDSSYSMPSSEKYNQFIVISTKENGNQLMPRFVNTDENYTGQEKEERILNFHTLLLETNFNSEIWQQILAYFNICIEHELPFSTFDQLRAISKSSRSAARVFFFLGINQAESDNFIQKVIPEMEMDLGFCFHWIKKEDWINALQEINELNNFQYFQAIFGLLSSYMQENNLKGITCFINGDTVSIDNVTHMEINKLRALLGHRVLNELPKYKPKITKFYTIPIEQHKQVGLLLHAPIAVAESICDIQHDQPIWGGDDFRNTIRRNIQYSQYLNPEFYNKTLLHTLKNC